MAKFQGVKGFRVWGPLVLCCLPMACDSAGSVSAPGSATTAEQSVAEPVVAAQKVAKPQVEQKPAAGAADSAVAVRVMSWDDAQKLVAGNKGKVVVVDVWSTACVPCIREFPHLVALQRELGEDVACISINIDYLGIEPEVPAELRDEVLTFLRQQSAAITNVICSDSADEIYEKVDFVSIPAVYVYGRSGELQKLFRNDAGEYGKEGFTYAKQIAPLVRDLAGTP